MRYLATLRVPLLVIAGLIALAVNGGASAQTVGGPGGACQAAVPGSVICTVTANAQLTAYNTVYVALGSPAVPLTQCNGQSGAYTVQGTATPIPPPIGGSGCEFKVVAGVAPIGSPVGTLALNAPALAAGTALQFAVQLCGDPSCITAGGVLGTATVPATVSLGTGAYCNNGAYGYQTYSYQQYCGLQTNTCQLPGVGYYSGTCTNGYNSCNGVPYSTGGYCNSSGFTYCNGVQVPVGTACTTAATGYTTCSNGEQVTLGTVCPGVTAGSVSYPAGWNLIGGPPGTVVDGAANPIYYLSPGSTTYQILPLGTAMTPGVGYWAYFAAAATTPLPAGSNGSVTVTLPPGQFITIADPSDQPAAVNGPAGLVVLVYSPATGQYTQTTQLEPGEGAWAALPQGGSITIAGTGTGGAFGSPPPPPAPLP